jgi:hypothetical protein
VLPKPAKGIGNMRPLFSSLRISAARVGQQLTARAPCLRLPPVRAPLSESHFSRWRSVRTSEACWYLRFRSFSQHLLMTSSNLGGRSGFNRTGGTGARLRVDSKMIPVLSPRNGNIPVAISYSTAPNENGRFEHPVPWPELARETYSRRACAGECQSRAAYETLRRTDAGGVDMRPNLTTCAAVPIEQPTDGSSIRFEP